MVRDRLEHNGVWGASRVWVTKQSRSEPCGWLLGSCMEGTLQGVGDSVKRSSYAEWGVHELSARPWL